MKTVLENHIVYLMKCRYKLYFIQHFRLRNAFTFPKCVRTCACACVCKYEKVCELFWPFRKWFFISHFKCIKNETIIYILFLVNGESFHSSQLSSLQHINVYFLVDHLQSFQKYDCICVRINETVNNFTVYFPKTTFGMGDLKW